MLTRDQIVTAKLVILTLQTGGCSSIDAVIVTNRSDGTMTASVIGAVRLRLTAQ